MEKKIEYHCPKCFFIPLYEVENDYKTLKIKCPNGHFFKYKIKDFFYNNPFVNTNIKCSHSSLENNVYDLLYCIQCNKYLCKKDIFDYHKNCRKIVFIEELFSICFEHKSPFISFCKICDKEVCNYCILNLHKTHLLSIDIKDICMRKQFLINNEALEKIFIEKLISENNYNEMKQKYKHLIQLYEFLKNIFEYEISNQRYSIILFSNIFNSNSILYKFKEDLKPKIKISNHILDNNFLNKFLESFKLYSQDVNDNIVLCNKKEKYFISKESEDNKQVIIKILKNNEIKCLSIDKNDLIDKDSICINIDDKRPRKEKDLSIKTFFNNNKIIVEDKKNIEKKDFLSYKKLMKDNKYFCEDLELEPKIMIKNLRQYILLENSYFLLLINISKKILLIKNIY